MITFNLRTQGSRKVVDLIYEISHGLFANIDPTSPIQVGDYGTVDKDTGRFTINGSVYTDFNANTKHGVSLPEPLGAEEKLILLSQNGTRQDFAAEIETNQGDVGVNNSKLRFAVEFPAGRSVCMALIEPQTTEIPQSGRLAQLATNRELLNMAVVDQIIKCPAYVLVITGTNGGKVNVSYSTQGIAPAEISGKWEITTSSGYERSASFSTAKCYLLYRLKLITRKGIRNYRCPTPPCSHAPYGDIIQEGEAIPDSARFPLYDVPWGKLDDEGDDEYNDDLDADAIAEVETYWRH